ncbi:piga-1 [Pristionchus pacificus]|uniref:phosphatidylinositol N-acetylglucosaminyltransferase n=1 Tax=Pristionchus pacificus TaxID=54126 RepID=A0A2A6B9H5_PRIPA|nr:piga-1 [Pristionchus pacificus]|eukprot:PDM62542.1 piga-1 [Pristionchus pacificus]
MGKTMRIALVSDFFCPNAGGVETHIYFLAQCLLKSGHEVIVITHGYGSRKGIRYLDNGLKVYYLPFAVIYNGCTLTSILGDMPIYRWIYARERTEIVHGHSTFSSMAHVAMFHGWQLGLRTVFTDHSLFGFADASSIFMNLLAMQYSLAQLNKAICVSYTSKENTVLRSRLDPHKVSTIPNAIQTQLFLPDPDQFYNNPTTIVYLGRLVYRKGADLLCDVIPRICARYPQVHFVIGGDGEKRVEIEQMLERADLQLRVRMLGMLPHDQVRSVLVQGQPSVRVSSRLRVVVFTWCQHEWAECQKFSLHSTSHSLIPLPERAMVPIRSRQRMQGVIHNMIFDLSSLCLTFIPSTSTDFAPSLSLHLFTKCSLQNEYNRSILSPISALFFALCESIDRREKGELPDPVEKHKEIQKMYVWSDVASRTQIVYESAMKEPRIKWSEGLRRYVEAGPGFGLVWMLAAAFNMLMITLMEWWRPMKDIPCGSHDWPRRRVVAQKTSKEKEEEMEVMNQGMKKEEQRDQVDDRRTITN